VSRTIIVPIVLVTVFAFLLVEARRASRNERAQRARGGIEPRGDPYAMMRVAYPGAFLAMIIEGAVRGSPAPAAVVAGSILFILAKALKWWAMLSLGPSWTFRVIVVPGADLVTSGPYRFLRHPNYVAVIGELVGVALVSGARVAGPLATAAFAMLMLKRITVENQALGAILRRN
jgi:methyltransferase